LSRLGERHFFLAIDMPVIFGLLLALTLSRSPRPPTGSRSEPSYRDLLLDERLGRAFMLAGGLGLIWGFPFPFMALTLAPYDIPAAYFFSFNTAAVVISRFVLLGQLQDLPRLRIVLIGAIAFVLGYAALVFAVKPVIVIVAGVLAGIGHGLVFPSLSTWVSEQFAPVDRGKPVALFNTIFNAGGYLVALAGGVLVAAFGMRIMLALVAATGLALAFGALSRHKPVPA
jgi:MFS family permease